MVQIYLFKCEVDEGNCKAPEWKRLSSKDLGISNSSISKPSRVVLDRLKKEGNIFVHLNGCGFEMKGFDMSSIH